MANVTIADVAARARVSKSTVSHALSGKRPISAATRQRIEQAIIELGYRPDPVAQSLATRTRHRGVGFVFPLLAPQVAELEVRFIASAADVINSAGYAFMLMTHLDDNIGHLEEFAASGLAQGFILMQVQMQDPRVAYLQARRIPFVLIGRCAENAGLTYVDSNIELGMQRCVARLAGLGHRRIAFLHQDDHLTGFAVRVLDAFQRSCGEWGVAAVCAPCALNLASGAEAMGALLDTDPEVTAVIVWNDRAAAGAGEAALARGRRVPQDLSLVCFNYSSLPRLLSLQPAVIDIQAETIAATAARMMLSLLEGVIPEPAQTLVEPLFSEGQSIAPPAF